MDDPRTSGMLGREMDLPAHPPVLAAVSGVVRAARVDDAGSPR
jgi:hypothetical protein